MSDRTSAEIFGEFFANAAKERKTPAVTRLVKAMWNEMKWYDFHPSDMDCDKALIKLGLAHMGVNEAYPEDGDVVLYGR